MKEYRKKIKKEIVDRCNICGEISALTWEHVPPKSCGNTGKVNISRIFDLEHLNEKLDSQNGIKYRTICSNCNNNILGANADVEFQKFYEQCKDFIETAKNIDEVGVVKINLISLIKCLFGKILAMGETYQSDIMSESMRTFILKDKLDSENLHVYFWLYPYNTTIQARSHVSHQVSGLIYNTEGLISLLYFYPVAFIVSNRKEKILMDDLMDFVDFNNPIVDVKLSPCKSLNPYTKKVLPYNWLINVDDGYVILSGDEHFNRISKKY